MLSEINIRIIDIRVATISTTIKDVITMTIEGIMAITEEGTMVKRLDVTDMKLMVKTMILLFAENISQITDFPSETACRKLYSQSSHSHNLRK